MIFMKVKNLVFYFLVLLLLVSCDYKTKKPVIPNTDDIVQNGISTESPTYFEYDAEKESYSFSIVPVIKNTGYTYWASTGEFDGSDFGSLKYSVKKLTGSEEATYGIVFFINKKDGKQNFEMCMINTKGQYLAGRVENGQFSYISERQDNNFLNRGYDRENTISVSYDKDEQKYKVLFNNYLAYSVSYEADELNTFSYGIAVVVSGAEKKESLIFERID